MTSDEESLNNSWIDLPDTELLNKTKNELGKLLKQTGTWPVSKSKKEPVRNLNSISKEAIVQILSEFRSKDQSMLYRTCIQDETDGSLIIEPVEDPLGSTQTSQSPQPTKSKGSVNKTSEIPENSGKSSSTQQNHCQTNINPANETSQTITNNQKITGENPQNRARQYQNFVHNQNSFNIHQNNSKTRQDQQNHDFNSQNLGNLQTGQSINFQNQNLYNQHPTSNFSNGFQHQSHTFSHGQQPMFDPNTQIFNSASYGPYCSNGNFFQNSVTPNLNPYFQTQINLQNQLQNANQIIQNFENTQKEMMAKINQLSLQNKKRQEVRFNENDIPSSSSKNMSSEADQDLFPSSSVGGLYTVSHIQIDRRMFRKIHPWSKWIEQLFGIIEPIRNLSQVDDFSIIRAINRYAVDKPLNKWEETRIRLLLYAISATSEINQPTSIKGSNSVLKTLVLAIDSSVYNQEPVSTDKIDMMSLKHSVKRTENRDTFRKKFPKRRSKFSTKSAILPKPKFSRRSMLRV